uniref:Endonuclease/exonuclease/phosphatase domain-containing protein n=1 Tax=Latimeria chalumnae TaxID=7897 RepID=H2ZY78_LATCH
DVDVSGAKGNLSLSLMLREVTTLECNIALLQEMHLTEQEAAKLNRQWVGQAYLSTFDSKSRGVSILIGKQVPWIHQDTRVDKEGRYIIRGSLFNQEYTIINVYAPNTHQASFITDIIKILAEGRGVVGGDLNAVLDTALDRSSRSLAWDGKNLQALKLLCKEGGLYDAWRIFNPKGREYTYYLVMHKSYTRLDSFLISHSILMNLLECKIGSFTLSDHAPVFMSFLPKPDLVKSKQRRFNNTLLRDSKFMQKSKSFFFQNNTGTLENVSTVWGRIQNPLQRQHIRKKERMASRQKPEEDLEEAECKHMLNPGDAQLFVKLQLAKTALHSHIDKQTEFALFRLRKKYFESRDKAGTLLTRSLKKRDSLYVIPGISKQMGDYTSSPQLINKEFKEFYRKLYASRSMVNYWAEAKLPKISEEDQGILDGPLKTEEVVEAIGKLSSGKAPGND